MPRGETDRERIARIIRDKIQTGQYQPGERIPSAVTLSTTYSVSPRTAQFALALLKDEGLITTHYGRGSYVAETLPGLEPARNVEDRLADIERRLDALEQRNR